MHTPQSLYDAVARHLLTQREPSRVPPEVPCVGNGCAYRGERGLKCAIGALIPDELYRPEFEQVGVGEYGPEGAAIRAAAGIPEDNPTMLNLAGRLQALHDNQRPEAWRGCLERVAADYGLSMPEVPA